LEPGLQRINAKTPKSVTGIFVKNCKGVPKWESRERQRNSKRPFSTDALETLDFLMMNEAAAV
jgi:hypothetical protein